MKQQRGQQALGDAIDTMDDAVKRMQRNLQQDLRSNGNQIIIANRYRVDKKLGKGSFGILYQGVDIRSNEPVAIKLESVKTQDPLLQYEANLYGKFKGLEGISQMHWHGVKDDFNVLILDLLGPTLQELFDFCNRKFTNQTLCWIGYEMIERIE